ncbi:ABC transporter ATP-binding protein [bacterium D16-51]|nr:ABC transporter ATP-binding protein [bacterium D16-59]RKI54608.1 ABC transporter ATP-binding protein [bacterium D16-51]
MKEKFLFYIKRIREGRLKEMIEQTIWIYAYVRKYWFAIIIYTGIGLIGTGTSLFTSVLSKDLVDIITQHKASELVKTLAMYIGFTLANLLLSQTLDYISMMISIKVDNEIKADVFEKMLLTRLEPLMAYHTGDLLTRWSSDASTISDGVLSWIPNLVINTARFISALAIVLYYDPVFALLAMAGMPVSLIMSKTLLTRMQARNQESAALSAKMMGFNQETFSNIQTIKAFDLIPLYVRTLRQYQKDFWNLKKKYQKLGILISIFMSLVGLAVSYSCYGMGIYRVWTGSISYGTMTLFLSMSGTLTGTLNSLMQMVPSAIGITTSAGRLIDILGMPREDYSAHQQVEEFYNRNKDVGLTLSIKDMDYAYYNGNQIFCKTSFFAKPHEIVALVGPSGEGKTTLLRIILALLEPQAGSLEIYAEGREADRITYSPSVRQLFSYVPQGNTMFSGTVAENMRNVKPDATDEEIISCLKTACAWDFINKLPDGIQSKIGERGSGFSEGQAQRLSIARALIKKSPILLMDEATSALDVDTERNILRNIMKDDYPRTCIVTTHRPSVLTICKNVYAIRSQRCVLLSEEETAAMLQHN